MYDNIPENVLNGIKISVIDLQKHKNKDDAAAANLDSSSAEVKKRKKSKSKKDNDKSKDNKKKDYEPSKFAIFTAELIGTGLLMFLGCMGCITGVDDPPPTHHFGSIAFGLTVMLIIQVFGHISGAHLNPQVTIATVYLGYLKPIMLPIYFVAEFLGAILGFGLLKILVPTQFLEVTEVDSVTNETIRKSGLCTTLPHDDTSTLQAVAIEAIITAVLILVCCSVWDRRNAHKADSVPLRFGFIIAVISITTGPFTGASMNTARTFAPALLNGDWDYQWIYWVGPTLGAILGAGLYKYLYSIPDEEVETEEIKSAEQLEDIPLNKV